MSMKNTIQIQPVAGVAETSTLSKHIPKSDEKSTAQQHHATNVKRTQRKSSSNKKKDPNYVPRPPNAFFLFRSDYVANRPKGKTKGLSKEAGAAWKSLPLPEKKKWAKMAHDVAVEHAKKHPTYRYQPVRKLDKSREEKSQEQQPPPQQCQPSTEVPASTATFLQGGVPPPDLLRRRESLRLSNWDDSVLAPNSHIAAYPNERLGQLPELWHRRSSSVPVPEIFYSIPPASSSTNMQHILPIDSFSNVQRRLSYSGIRPGFMPTENFFSHQDPLKANISEGRSRQPLWSLYDGPPPSFEGYSIQAVPTPPSVSTEHQPVESTYALPFNQALHFQGTSTTHSRQWENSAMFSETFTVATPDISKGVSSRPIPPVIRRGSPLIGAHREVPILYSETPQQPAMTVAQVAPNVLTPRSFDIGGQESASSNPGPSAEYLGLHDSGDIHHTSSGGDYQLDTPILEFLHQYERNDERFSGPSSSLANLYEGDAIVASNEPDTLHGLTGMPCGKEASLFDSRPGSSSTSKQHLDFEWPAGK